MKKTIESREARSAAGHFSAAHVKSVSPGKDQLFTDREQSVFLTSPIGTQPLLMASSPCYPIIKAAEVVTEE